MLIRSHMKSAKFGLSVLVLVVAMSANAVTWYVSPKGNDEWSGRRAEGRGPDGPFATPARALKAAREAGAGKQGTILLRGGTYELAEALKISAEDSGDPRHPLTIEPYRSEKPVLSGGRRL